MVSVEFTKHVACPWGPAAVQRVIATAARRTKTRRAVVSVSVIGPAAMTKLNKTWRGVRQVTDVLSFPNQIKGFITPSSTPPDLGDVVICYAQIVRQAKEYQRSPRYEFSLMLVHGWLHLLGYDHEQSVAAETKMNRLQDTIMKDLRFVK